MLQATSRQAAKQQQVYLDLSVDGEPKGRLVIELSGDAPVGTQRFVELSQGLNGVGYRLSKFDGIAQVLLIALHHTQDAVNSSPVSRWIYTQSFKMYTCQLILCMLPLRTCISAFCSIHQPLSRSRRASHTIYVACSSSLCQQCL